ncbi:MAG: hypothetical protein ABIH50_07335 [bacterium]
MQKPKYYLSKTGDFVIENYNHAPTFSSFFSGIAGVYGCPMWIFYTNRGQCIASAGIQDKDGAIIEFQPANKAYRGVSLTGFRTFLKVDGVFYEPFNETSLYHKEMKISFPDLKIIETNPKLKIKVEVTYFTIPNASFPALARVLKVTNLSTKKRQIEVIDGLPVIIPYGFSNDLLKRISQTIEAWCAVENIENNAPFYRLKIMPVDAAETKFLEKGNFFFSFARQDQQQQPVKIIINPALVFGENSSLESPDSFVHNKNYKVASNQLTCGYTPCAFAFKKFELDKNEPAEIFSLLGQAESLQKLENIKKQASEPRFFETKHAENEKLISDLCSFAKTNSASKKFDLYTQQTFIDNTMRGGFPINIGSKVFYTYYRKHGDMERDYNEFRLMPTYFSQGNGNYRDINQNRRNDIFTNPNVNSSNIHRFFNLLQLDGFNPLVVFGSKYYLASLDKAQAITNKHFHFSSPQQTNQLTNKLTNPFVLGQLLKELEDSGVTFKASREDFVTDLIENSIKDEGAIHGEGFWTDHFTYNLDLLESYEAVFPDKINYLLFQEKTFTFFDNSFIVLPRKTKYHQVNGHLRQLEGVKEDAEKRKLIEGRKQNAHLVRTDQGNGKVYYTTLAAKLLCLIANKACSFDAEGIGIEMEADKPNWYDALNGLPALFGSSLSETLELKRLCLYLLERLAGDTKILLATEIKAFIDKISGHLDNWEAAHQSKETFREQIKFGVSGKEEFVDVKFIRSFVTRALEKCDNGIKKCLSRYNNYYTYFINEAVEFEKTADGVIVKKFTQKPLPLFLEGFVHALKVEKDKKIHQVVKNSPLYDRKLKMYKVNAPLDSAPLEIGRARIFVPGWLENESIWLHMEYKYMLELLKAGMYKEFFEGFKQVFVPFMDPKVYKRSIFENSSFIVSSANPNKGNHGRGFVARLSGGAAEFIDIWLILTSGKKIFYLDASGKLCFKLSPSLPTWLFKNGKFSFNLLGAIEVVYINKKKKNTFDGGVVPVAYKLTIDGKEVDINSPYICEPYSRLIREKKVQRIVVTLS